VSENTKIQWADHTFNPWEGCTKVSEGCQFCYALTRNQRFAGGMNWGKGMPRRRTSAANWRKPLQWDKHAFICPVSGSKFATREACINRVRHIEPRRTRVFCASLADWLDEEVPIEWLADLLKVIHDTPNLDWLLLTKRPENWLPRMHLLQNTGDREDDLSTSGPVTRYAHCIAHDWLRGSFPANVWIGTSIENQKRADERIPELLKIPARVRFLSVEPMLGPVDVASWGWRNTGPTDARVNWVIFGGESGTGARPCNIEWIRDGVKQCRAAGVAPFVKQLGSNPYFDFSTEERAAVRLKNKKGGEMSEWPEDLKIREFPC